MKYYTPHKDEFHHNFRYELQAEDEWEQKLFKLNTKIPFNRTRVKQLCADDIIESGFDLTSENVEYYTFKTVYKMDPPSVIEVRLHKQSPEPVLQVFINKNLVVNSLIVKNVNEFEWLITRLLDR